MVPSLVENGRYSEAFELLKIYGQNFGEALQCLLKGKLFQKAICEAKLQNNEALIGRHIHFILV